MIERAKSYRRVKALAPDWDMLLSDDVYYLVVVENGKDLGVFCFHPTDEDGLLMHVVLGEECRGIRAAKAYRSAFEWMFENTDCEKLLGRIPQAYRHARVMARHIGGVFTGLDVDGLRCYNVKKSNFQRVL